MSCRQNLWLHCGSETKALTAMLYLHSIGMLYSHRRMSDLTHTHTFIFFLHDSDTVTERILHKHRACHFPQCFSISDIKELTHTVLCVEVTLRSYRGTTMSHGWLECQLCSLTHSLQTLHHTFTYIPTSLFTQMKERDGGPFPSGVSTLPSLSCPPPLFFSTSLYLTLSLHRPPLVISLSYTPFLPFLFYF